MLELAVVVAPFVALLCSGLGRENLPWLAAVAPQTAYLAAAAAAACPSSAATNCWRPERRSAGGGSSGGALFERRRGRPRRRPRARDSRAGSRSGASAPPRAARGVADCAAWPRSSAQTGSRPPWPHLSGVRARFVLRARCCRFREVGGSLVVNVLSRVVACGRPATRARTRSLSASARLAESGSQKRSLSEEERFSPGGGRFVLFVRLFARLRLVSRSRSRRETPRPLTNETSPARRCRRVCFRCRCQMLRRPPRGALASPSPQPRPALRGQTLRGRPTRKGIEKSL